MTKREQQQAAAQAPAWMIEEELEKIRTEARHGRRTVSGAPIDEVIGNLEQMLHCRRIEEAVAERRAADAARSYGPPPPDAAARDAAAVTAAAGSQPGLF